MTNRRAARGASLSEPTWSSAEARPGADGGGDRGDGADLAGQLRSPASSAATNPTAPSSRAAPSSDGGQARHEHRDARRADVVDGGEHGDAVEAGEVDVEEQQVGLAPLHERDRLAAVGRLGDDVEAGIAGEGEAQQRALVGHPVGDDGPRS